MSAGRQFIGRPDLAPVPVATADVSAERPEPLSVAAYLDHDLVPYARIRDLEQLANRVASADLDDVIRDLRNVLTSCRISGADFQRLNVLLSQLYHAHSALDGPQLDQLRSEVKQAWELSRSGAALRETREE